MKVYVDVLAAHGFWGDRYVLNNYNHFESREVLVSILEDQGFIVDGNAVYENDGLEYKAAISHIREIDTETAL